MTSTASTAHLPAVECAEWCEDGNGHADEWHPDNQECIGQAFALELTQMPLRDPGTDDATRDALALNLQRPRDARSLTVELCHGDRPVASLMTAGMRADGGPTCGTARQHGDAQGVSG